MEAGAPVQAEAAIRAEVAAVIQGGAGATAIQRGAGSPEEPARVPRLAPAEFRVNLELLDPFPSPIRATVIRTQQPHVQKQQI